MDSVFELKEDISMDRETADGGSINAEGKGEEVDADLERWKLVDGLEEWEIVSVGKESHDEST